MPILTTTNLNQQGAIPDFSGLGPKESAHLRLLWDRVNSLQGRSGDQINQYADVNVNGNQVTNVANPVNPQDAVTLSYAQTHFGASTIKTALQVGGSAPLNVTGLPGTNTGLILDTHANRLSKYANPTAGAAYFEVDRQALYFGNNANSWVWAGSAPYQTGAPGQEPSDLGGNDAGFAFFNVQTGVTSVWDGATWHLHNGMIVDVIANRPTAFSGCDAGLLFCGTDMGDHVWELNYAAGAWLLLKGVGGPLAGNLASKPTLGGFDAGFQYAATDFDRCYNWSGSAWFDSPGQPERGQICFFNNAPGTGWALCNGGGATSSTSAGGTTGITTPNLISVYVQGYTSAGITGLGVSLSYTTGSTNYTAIPFYSLLPYIRL